MARWHNGLLPKRNTWRRLGSTGLSVYHGLFNAKLLVKLWCIPLFQGKQLDVPLVVFQQIQHPLGKRSPLRPLWPWLLDDMWTRSCFFPPCSAAAIGLAFFVEFLWQLEIIDDIQPYIWGVSGKLFSFWSLSQCCFFAIDWRIWLIWPVLGDSNNDKPMVAIPSNIDFHHFDPLNDTTHLPGITLMSANIEVVDSFKTWWFVCVMINKA